jgi:uncharacterized repeat protein (TIGR01451 family)
MTVKSQNQFSADAQVSGKVKSLVVIPVKYNRELHFVFNLIYESDRFTSVNVGLSMNPRTGTVRVLWAKAKWAGAPTFEGLRELSEILVILAELLRVPALLAMGLVIAMASPANAQVINGDFSAGTTGWTSTAPSNSTLTFTGGVLTAVSDNNGGTNSRTFASQTITTGDPGFLSYQLVSYTTADYGQYDYPTVRIGGTYYWITTAGALVTSGAGVAIDNDDAPIGVSGVFVLGNTTTLIGFGVTATDSCCGAGTAQWDNIEFQQLTQSPGAQVTPFNTPRVLSGANAPQVATNSGAASMSITVSVTNGILNLASTTGITITSGANGTSTMTFTGTPTNINNALNGLTYTPTTGYSGGSVLTFFANGGGTSDTDTIGITVSPPVYAFTLAKIASVGSVSSAGTVINYTITVTNTGTGSLTGITVSDILSQGVTNTAKTLTGPSGDGGTIGTMEAGEVWVYTASHTVTQAQMDNGANLVNTVTFDTAQTPAQNASATTTITANPSLVVTKVADDDTNVTVGQLITYTYTVTNNGNQTISNISLSDNVTAGSGSAPTPNADTATLTDNLPTGDSTNPGTGDGDWDTLAPGDVLTVTSTYTVTQTDVDTLQ